MKFATFNFQNNPNIGLFGFSTDKFCLTNKHIREKDAVLLGKILKVPIYKIEVLGTDLIGIFVAGNSNGVIISNRIYEEEIKELKIICNTLVLETKYTALGNMILANDKGCIISKELEPFIKDIRNFLGIDTKVGTIGNMNLVGSLAIANSHGCLTHKAITRKEKELIEKTLEVKVSPSSVNFGNQWVKTGVIANSNGFLAGEKTSGAELGAIAEALGFV